MSNSGNFRGPPSTVEAQMPTTSMIHDLDGGDAPAAEPTSLTASTLDRYSDSVMSSLTTPSVEEQRREARRNKRMVSREKRSGIDGPGLRTEAGYAPGAPMPDYDDDDVENFQMPGSFAVAGPAARQAEAQGGWKADPDNSFEDIATLPEGGGGEDDKNQQNLPVAFEAEVVFDYPNSNVVVAQKDHGHRTVPLKWLVIGGCLMFIGAVAISVSLGVALGGRDDTSSSSDSLIAQPTFPPAVAPTFTPVEAPTFTPVVPPTFTPVVAPTFTPVVPPTFPPQDGVTFQPVPAPTFQPVVSPTYTPVVPPTFTPVVPPTAAPVASTTQPIASPTQPPIASPTEVPVVAPTEPPVSPPTESPVEPPTQAPVVPPTDRPVDPPTEAPVEPPTEPPVEPPTERPVPATEAPVEPGRTSSNNPIYTGSDGLRCQCRFYTQDFIVSSTSDYRSLSSNELQAYIDVLLQIVDEFNPYPFRRVMTADQPALRARVLEPTEISYSISLERQSRLGTSGTDPFGNRMTISYEFCVDDEPFVEDYHDAFVSYLRNGSNRDSMASQIRNAGLSSLTEVTVPNETGDICEGR